MFALGLYLLKLFKTQIFDFEVHTVGLFVDDFVFWRSSASLGVCGRRAFLGVG